jgi:hypothetical protein
MMGNYDTIQIPIPGQPVSKSQYGDRVRAAIIDLDTRVARIESTIANYAFKQTTTTRANTTTVSDDPDLKMWLEANSKYFVEFFVTCAATIAEDIKTAWSVPAGTLTTVRRVLGPGSTQNQVDADNLAIRIGTHVYATTVLYSGVRNSTALQFQFQEVAVVRTGATAGYVALQWAQGTSGATGALVCDDSFCRASKLP